MTAISASSPGLSGAYQAQAQQARQQEQPRQPPPPPPPQQQTSRVTASPGPGIGQNIDIQA